MRAASDALIFSSSTFLLCWGGMVRVAIGLVAACLVGLFSISVSQSATRLGTSPTLAVSDSGTWKPVQKGIEFRKMVLERSQPSHSVDLKLIRFDTNWIVPRVLRSSQYQLKSADAKKFVEKSGAVAAINASYFDTEGKPLAFLKSNSQAVNSKISKSSLYSGIFRLKDQRPLIVHRDDFNPEDADEALQSGPLLLLRSVAQPVTGLPSRASRRALIGVDQEQRVVIAVTDSLIGGLHWSELQEIFSAPLWQIQTADLLNLDGGGSAQLYLKAGKFEQLVPGTSEVPVAIGFFTRAR
jgi:uncharacterized protein YigE (DUF2233 family)